MRGIDPCCLHFFTLFKKDIPGGKRLILPVNACLLQHIGIAENDRHITHKGNGPHPRVLRDGGNRGIVKPVLISFLRLIYRSQIQKIDSLLILAHVAGTGKEHVRKPYSGHQAGQQIRIIFSNQGDRVDIRILFTVLLHPPVKQLSLIIQHSIGIHPEYEIILPVLCGIAGFRLCPAPR